MVKRIPVVPAAVEPASKEKQAPEDSSMKDGIFKEDNASNNLLHSLRDRLSDRAARKLRP